MKRVILLVLLFAALVIPTKAQSPGSINWKGTPHGVSLSCTSNGGIGFNFYRGTTSGGPYVKVNTAATPTCAFQDQVGTATGPLTSTTYFYVATSVDASGNESAYSLEASVVTPSTFQANPAPPSKPVATVN